MQNITVLPCYVVSEDSLSKVSIITKDVDFKDVWFVALSIEYDLPLLTRDRKLYEGLRRKEFRKIIMFDQFLNSLLQ